MQRSSLLARLFSVCLAISAAAIARAGAPAVAFIYPLTPISVGSTSIEVAVDVDGSASAVVLSAAGHSASGSFAGVFGRGGATRERCCSAWSRVSFRRC